MAKANITGAVTAILMGQVLPSDFTWRTKSNTSVPMNADQVKGLGLAMMSYTTILFQWSWNLKNFLLGQTSVEAILGLDVTNSWPSNNYDGTGPGPSTMQTIGQMMQAMAPPSGSPPEEM